LTRVAIYTRVSTEDQAKEGFSLDAQRERLRAYCQARGWHVAKEYVDEGHSGRNTKRPAYQRMMGERDTWETILVIKMDRIHRNAKNFMLMMEDLRAWGKDFVSATESLDTSTAMGRFVMDIIQRIAQLESEQIGERVRMGMEQKAKEPGAGILGFPPPFGYDLSEGVLVPKQEEAAVVREMYRLALEGASIRTIARTVTERHPTKRGKAWNPMAVHYILHNPLYAGYLRWDDHVRKGRHDPLVSREEWNAVQWALWQRTPLRRGTRPSILLEEDEALAAPAVEVVA
jgi:DNA invertase Pin-like site-specific DNA recombinase